MTWYNKMSRICYGASWLYRIHTQVKRMPRAWGEPRCRPKFEQIHSQITHKISLRL
jgi:hypothetical protein